MRTPSPRRSVLVLAAATPLVYTLCLRCYTPVYAAYVASPPDCMLNYRLNLGEPGLLSPAASALAWLLGTRLAITLGVLAAGAATVAYAATSPLSTGSALAVATLSLLCMLGDYPSALACATALLAPCRGLRLAVLYPLAPSLSLAALVGRNRSLAERASAVPAACYALASMLSYRGWPEMAACTAICCAYAAFGGRRGAPCAAAVAAACLATGSPSPLAALPLAIDAARGRLRTETVAAAAIVLVAALAAVRAEPSPTYNPGLERWLGSALKGRTYVAAGFRLPFLEAYSAGLDVVYMPTGDPGLAGWRMHLLGAEVMIGEKREGARWLPLDVYVEDVYPLKAPVEAYLTATRFRYYLQGGRAAIWSVLGGEIALAAWMNGTGRVGVWSSAPGSVETRLIGGCLNALLRSRCAFTAIARGSLRVEEGYAIVTRVRVSGGIEEVAVNVRVDERLVRLWALRNPPPGWFCCVAPLDALVGLEVYNPEVSFVGRGEVAVDFIAVCRYRPPEVEPAGLALIVRNPCSCRCEVLLRYSPAHVALKAVEAAGLRLTIIELGPGGEALVPLSPLHVVRYSLLALLITASATSLFLWRRGGRGHTCC